MEKISEHSIVRFEHGKKGNFIGHTEEGKVILSRNKADAGYYELSNVEEKETVIVANTKKVPYDYFPGITYDEFLDVLRYNGFKIGFVEDFHHVNGNYTGDDHLVFAYDMDTHIIIVAESWDSGRTFNSIEVYCPGIDAFKVKTKLFSHGSGDLAVFNLVYTDIFYQNKGVIHMLKENMHEIVEAGKNVYTENHIISLWNNSEDSDAENFYEKSREKIKRADRSDMLKLFAHADLMLAALNS